MILIYYLKVPQFYLDFAIASEYGSMAKVVCTQPRKISAISVAERVAEERGELCGESKSSVGYKVRCESMFPRETGSIIYCTTGVVLQWMRSNPLLLGYSCIILDEIHERDILCDFLITALRDILHQRKDLRVVLMSATLNAKAFSDYFQMSSGQGCPVINIPGFTYEVEEFHLEGIVQTLGVDSFAKRNSRETLIDPDVFRQIQKEISKLPGLDLETRDFLMDQRSLELNLDLVHVLVAKIHQCEDEGAILIFLPGWDDISYVANRLEQTFGDVVVYPLHSQLATINQKAIFDTPSSGTRKIVVATNIAETSITIEDVVYVVDCGKIKMHNYDPDKNLTTLTSVWESKANAKQRRGRAGRTRPGKCYKLFTKATEKYMEDFMMPEILRRRLEEVILSIKVLGLGKIDNFLSNMLTTPKPKAITNAVETLIYMNALVAKDEELTPLGYCLGMLPVDPQLGRMILFSIIFRCLDPILSLAAALSYKDPFLIPTNHEEVILAEQARKKLCNQCGSDHFLIINAINEYAKHKEAGDSHAAQQFCRAHYLNDKTLDTILDIKQQFVQLLWEQNFLETESNLDPNANINSNQDSLDLVRAVITAGLYPNLLRIEQDRDNIYYLDRQGKRRVRPHKRSFLTERHAQDLLKRNNWLVYHLMMATAYSTSVHDCSLANALDLSFFGFDFDYDENRIKSVSTRRDLRFYEVMVDDDVKLPIERNTAEVLYPLRQAFNEAVDYICANPSNHWRNREDSRIQKIIKLVGDMLTYEVEENEDDEWLTTL